MPFIFIVFLVFGLALPASAESLKILYGSNSVKPFIFVSETKNPSGLLIDIGAETARRLGLEARSVIGPRKRLLEYMRSGKADLICNARPEWFGNPDYLTYVETFPDQDIYLTKMNTQFDFSNPLTLKSSKIGTVLGFHYDEAFMQALEYGAIHHAVIRHGNIWALLDRGRMDAIVVSKTIAQYHLTQVKNAETYAIVDAGSPVSMRYCAVMTKHSRKDEIVAALKAMKADGTLEKLHLKYR